MDVVPATDSLIFSLSADLQYNLKDWSSEADVQAHHDHKT